MKPIALNSGVGEIMATQTLVASLVLSPDGSLAVDSGALHGRSELEQALTFAKSRSELNHPQCAWVVWVAVELDSADRPHHYKGVAVSALWVDAASNTGYKSVTESVNRMSEAMRGGVNVNMLDGKAKALIGERLRALDEDVWDRSSASFREALR